MFTFFCSKHKIAEEEFYNFFSSLRNIETEIFAQFALKSLEVIEKDENYAEFDNKQKLLAFYYTFFEMLNLNRSYVLLSLSENMYNLKFVKKLSKLKSVFQGFIDSLGISLFTIENTNINKFQSKSISESYWAQMLYTLKFWMEDESKSFEKTDIFIEKSINASFDIIDSPPRKSVMDLAKFMFKEKFNSAV
jgi:hypothetical protein